MARDLLLFGWGFLRSGPVVVQVRYGPCGLLAAFRCVCVEQKMHNGDASYGPEINVD